MTPEHIKLISLRCLFSKVLGTYPSFDTKESLAQAPQHTTTLQEYKSLYYLS